MTVSKRLNCGLWSSVALIICLIGALAGTQSTSVAQVKPSSKASPDSDDEHYYWKIGGPDGKGNVLFANWDNRAYIYLLSDYGFMVINGGSYKHPKPIFLIGELKRRKVTAYTSISSLSRALRNIPRGTRVPKYTVCTAGTAPGVKGNVWDRVGRAFKTAHLKYDPDNYNVMYDVCGEGADPLPSVGPEMKAAFVKVYGKAAYEAHNTHH